MLLVGVRVLRAMLSRLVDEFAQLCCLEPGRTERGTQGKASYCHPVVLTRRLVCEDWHVLCCDVLGSLCRVKSVEGDGEEVQ